MAELNDRAREHAEASRRAGAEALSVPTTASAIYYNPAGDAVYGYYDSSFGGGFSFGPTEPLPDVLPNVIHHSGSSGTSFSVVTIIDDWTKTPWVGWKAILTLTAGLPVR